MLCLELFSGARHGCINIVVICMLNKVAEHLRAFLRWALPKAMERLRVSLGWWTPSARYDNFNFDTLVQLGMLRVLGPIAVRGFTFKVAFWLGLRRRLRDETWFGLILCWNVLYVHFTRASDRLYILMEDLREGILLPESGALRSKGLRMGVKGSDDRYRNNDDALVRRHLFMANLYCVSDRFWWDLGTGRGANYSIGKASMTSIPAILTSAAVRGAIRLPFEMPDASNAFLACCCACYSKMAGWWRSLRVAMKKIF